MLSLRRNIFIVISACTIINATALNSNETFDFPSNFSFGIATAAYQIEGAWNTDGKGPSIWDTFTHQNASKILDHSNADISADSYHQFEQDLKALKNLGVQHYRFSISWPRILPNGDVSSLNKAGIDYYKRVIDKLIENGIEPMVTMFHYDLPDELQKIGGLANPIFIKYFVEYARVLFTHFGDKVKYWITINEPLEFCIYGYGSTTSAPAIDAPGIADYLCIDHTIKAHAQVYRLYRKDFYDRYKGKIGMVFSVTYYYSKANDTKSVDRALQFRNGWFLHPIYSESGGYPSVVVETIGNNSKNEGRPWSRLPYMDDEWKNITKKSGDFIGINYYSSSLIENRTTPANKIPSWDHDFGYTESADPSWKKSKADWLHLVPEGLGQVLRWLKNEYNNTEVIITENGWPDNGELLDYDRIEYLRKHLLVLSDAIKDGCNVTGYTTWSLIDDFEYAAGYTLKFGLYSVDFKSGNKNRTAKKSADYMKTVIQTRKIPPQPNSSFSRASPNSSSSFNAILFPLIVFYCIISILHSEIAFNKIEKYF